MKTPTTPVPSPASGRGLGRGSESEHATHARHEPTAEELLRAYNKSALRKSGVSLHKALTTKHIYIALRNCANALSKQPATH